jgi:hypothetical protein
MSSFYSCKCISEYPSRERPALADPSVDLAELKWDEFDAESAHRGYLVYVADCGEI